MCLTISKTSIKTTKAALNKKGYIIAYKVLEKEPGGLSSIIFPKTYKPGWNFSDRLTASLNALTENQTVNQGIHVYLTKSTAKAKCFSRYRVLMPVKCFKEDFVAAGYGEAVFTKVFIRKHDIRRYIKG